MMKATGIRRGLGLLAVVVAVAAIAAGVLRYGYMQALDGLSQRGEADLALASDRLTGQVQRYRDLENVRRGFPGREILPGEGDPGELEGEAPEAEVAPDPAAREEAAGEGSDGEAPGDAPPADEAPTEAEPAEAEPAPESGEEGAS